MALHVVPTYITPSGVTCDSLRDSVLSGTGHSVKHCHPYARWVITRTYVKVRSQKSHITTDHNHEPSDAWPNSLFDNNVAKIIGVKIDRASVGGSQ